MAIGAFQAVLLVKNPPANGGNITDYDFIPGSGRSPGGGHSNPLQYSCLENPMDRGCRVGHNSTDLALMHATAKQGLPRWR